MYRLKAPNLQANDCSRSIAQHKHPPGHSQSDEGHEIYPALLSEYLFQIPGLIDFQAELVTFGNKEGIIVHVEHEGDPYSFKEAIKDKLKGIPAIKSRMEEGSLDELRVIETQAGSLKQAGRIKKTISDNR